MPLKNFCTTAYLDYSRYFLYISLNYVNYIQALDSIFYEFTDKIKPASWRRVIYRIFECSPNIPFRFIAPVNPWKMRSLVL